VDGTAVGQMAGTYHWEFMRRLIDRLPAKDDRRRIAQIYLRATAAELERWGEYPELSVQLAAGRKLLGDDSVLLMYEGTMYQAYAGARAQRFFTERRRAQSKDRPIITVMSNPTMLGNNLRSAPLNNGVGDALPAVRGLRQQAARTFRRALSLDPALAEARIRLAQIVGDDDQHEEAVTELTRAMAAPLTPFLGYYAALVMGREQRALGQLDEAQASFERARAIYPAAAPPRFGLSEIALTRGDADRARALLSDLTPPQGDVNLLWGRIDRIHDPSAQSLLNEMRRVFSQ
jgi:tetratricopeptide (TPR) repeat protein